MTTNFRRHWAKLRDKIYRQHLVEAEVKRGIPFQMRALLQKQKLSQEELAARAGLTQGAVSRALNPNYGNLTLNTIIRIAAGLDVAFVGTFIPFSELVRKHEALSEDTSGDVQTFDEEDAAIETTSVPQQRLVGMQLVEVVNRQPASTKRSRQLQTGLDRSQRQFVFGAQLKAVPGGGASGETKTPPPSRVGSGAEAVPVPA